MSVVTENLAAEIGSRCMIRQRHSLLRRLRTLEGLERAGKPHDQSLKRLEQEVARSRAVYEKRAAGVPAVKYPAELPVVQRREEIARAITQNQVVVVCGETGSGKTTQLPKICLELGRGVAGFIGHTQPRRIAARSVAGRIAQELSTSLGGAVGYKVRFSDRLSELTYIKLMTDGILLAETQHDRHLEAYDTIIIDEAHERSLNIDFLLGYLKQLLPKRPELKVIVTSATIDPQRFSKHFNDAPIVEVSGRTYPVQVRYRPPAALDEDEDPDPIEAITSAIDELWHEGPGDVLLFLTGEREIRETAEALRKARPNGVEVLPLYARLSADDQMRVFAPHATPRIVLATNVAETSLTVPGIKYVIDPGWARVSRYAPRSRVQRLPIEKISRASADQRKGRCGRVSEGVCIRLYDERDYEARAEFTEPEILRTNLASVILQMKALRLGDVQAFPFMEPPDYRMIRDGFATLHELGAIDENNELTPLGRDLARLPIDPRIGRMVIEAQREGVLAQMLVIAAALSIQDPRERPLDKTEAADEAHARFADERSDFLSLLSLWQQYQQQAKEVSTNQLRKWCKTNFVSYVRMREWDDVHLQLRGLAHEVFGGHVNHRHPPKVAPAELAPRHVDAIHRAVLAGILSNVGYRSEAFEYTGPRGVKFNIFPGSALFKSKPGWVMAAELVETTRLYARTVAPIKPEWIEKLGAHLVKRDYTEPRWHMASGQVLAYEKVTFSGITLVPRRSVHYGPVDPGVSRQLFIQEALVNGSIRTDGEFLKHNRALVEHVLKLEAKRRRRDLLVSGQELFSFYDSRIGREGIYSGATFEKWRHYVERGRPTLLFMRPGDVMKQEVQEDLVAYPDELVVDGVTLPLRYVYDAADPADGITATVPLAALNQLPAEPLEWLVPGWLREKVVALIKSLPKALRVKFVPVPEAADRVMQGLREKMHGRDAHATGLLDAVAHQLGKIAGELIDREAFNLEELEPWLRMNFEVVDQSGAVIKSGRDLETIRRDLGMKARETFRAELPQGPWNRDEVTSWDFDDLPQSVEVRRNGMTLVGYPALADEGKRVALRLFDSPAAALEANRSGVRRLLTLQLREEVKWLSRKLPGLEEMCLNYASIASCEDLKADLVTAIADRALFEPGLGAVRTRVEFLDRARVAWERLGAASREMTELVAKILAQYQALAVELDKTYAPMLEQSVAEMREDLSNLIYDGFIVETPAQWLAEYPRYLGAISSRLRKLLNAGLTRDRAGAADVGPLWRQLLERRQRHRREGIVDPELELYRWMVEEFRVSVFAQELKTAVPVSVKRLEGQLAKVRS